MEIIKMRVADIKGATYNPRKKLRPGDTEFEKIKRSIEEFSLVEPLVWNRRTETLVGGHQRLAVLKHLGHDTVDVSVVDLDPAREKALNVALNKIAGEWDDEGLRALLVEVNDAGMLEMTGVDEAAWRKMMEQMTPLDLADCGGDAGGRTSYHCPKCGFCFEVAK